MCPISGYFDIPFAENGDLNTIPDATQPSGTVSYNQGFPVLYSTPVTSGGYNVPRTAINQALNDITTAIQFQQQGNAAPFITSSMNGGTPYSYPQYAVVLSGGVNYVSLVNSNTDTPPSSKWSILPLKTTLSANANYYVATTGSDSNPGTSASPWLTLQHAFNWISQNVTPNGFTVTINVADGTYTAGTVFDGNQGVRDISLTGNTTTPANCMIHTTGSNAVVTQNGAILNIGGFKLQTTSSGAGIVASLNSQVNINSAMEFGACVGAHFTASDNSRIQIQAAYTISGGSSAHWDVERCGVLICQFKTITLSGTPAFSVAFATAINVAVMTVDDNTFSGSATGTRYSCNTNAVINTIGGGASYLPGNSAGNTATGGQYV